LGRRNPFLPRKEKLLWHGWNRRADADDDDDDDNGGGGGGSGSGE